MALDLGRQRQHVGTAAGEVICGQQPCDDTGGARAHPAAERNRRVDPELEVIGRHHLHFCDIRVSDAVGELGTRPAEAV